MSNKVYISGAVPMVQIDGAKVRGLREAKGLTQLYLATAVDVTTDTISRWENRRYPSIKKENGIRLAEALEVELVEILEIEDGQEKSDERVAASSVIEPATTKQRRALKHLLIGCLLIIVVFVAIYFWLTPEHENEFLVAYRVLPVRVTAGQPFPVVIELLGKAEESQSIILKESLPAGSEIIQTVPPVTTTDRLGHELKWLKKINGRTRFNYLVKLQPGTEKSVGFSGTVAVGRGKVVAVQGNDQIIIDHSHWADRDGDSIISDTEILYVYDQFGEIEGLDMEQVEKMWAGSGYRWNSEQELFEVVE